MQGKINTVNGRGYSPPPPPPATPLLTLFTKIDILWMENCS